MLNQVESLQAYEPEWGHNSGNSYNNGPFTHFYHGKASPYSVVAEDVQLDDDEPETVDFDNEDV